MQSALPLTTLLFSLAAFVIVLNVLIVNAQDLLAAKRQKEDLGAWGAWTSSLREPSMAQKLGVAQHMTDTVEGVVQTGDPHAKVQLVGSYRNQCFHPTYSDIDIQVQLSTPDALPAVQNVLQDAGFPFKHAAKTYTLFSKPGDGSTPPVDVSVTVPGAMDSVHCEHTNEVTRQATGFLTHLIRSQYPTQHVLVRHWRPHGKI